MNKTHYAYNKSCDGSGLRLYSYRKKKVTCKTCLKNMGKR